MLGAEGLGVVWGAWCICLFVRDGELTVTSSFNDISTDQLGFKVVLLGVEGVTPPTPFHSRLLDRYVDDVNVFPPSRIFASWLLPYTPCVTRCIFRKSRFYVRR
jgi:hypothetical protein